MSPEDVIAQALHDVWQPVDSVEQFPSRWSQASAIVTALQANDFLLVKKPANLSSLTSALASRTRRTPTWSEFYDKELVTALDILTALEEQCVTPKQT